MPEMNEEVKKALEEQKKNCIFCKIIKGEIQSKKIFEDDLVFAILDINPAKKGHILLMPKEHYPIMPFLPPETFKRMFEVAQILAKSVKNGVVATGSTVFIANGFAAGQQSQHFMIHIIPRDDDDGLPFSDLEGVEADPEKISEIQKIVSHNLPIMMENHFKNNPQDWHTPRDVSQSKVFTKDQVIQIIEQNPQLKDLIIKQPLEFVKQAKVHPQLKQLFEAVNPKEIVEHYAPGALEKLKEAEIVSEEEKQSDNLDDETKNETASEDDIDSESKRYSDELENKEPEEDQEDDNSDDEDQNHENDEELDNEDEEEKKEEDNERKGANLNDIASLFR